MGEAYSYTLNGNVFQIRELNYKKDIGLFDEIVEHENRVFGEGSVGKWNIKPFTKYGKVFVVVKKLKNLENNREVKCNNSTYENKLREPILPLFLPLFLKKNCRKFQFLFLLLQSHQNTLYYIFPLQYFLPPYLFS